MSATPTFAPTRFQNFAIRTTPATVAPRLKALRDEMAKAGLDGFLIPRADAHRGESVPPGEARLAYVTSFTGSAGIAVVGPRKAGLFVDSRYTLQAPAETDTKKVTVIEIAQASLSERIGDFVPKGGRTGYDPWFPTPGEIKDLGDKPGDDATLVPSDNLVDRIWPDRPAAPVTPVEFLGNNRAGRSAADKLTELRASLAKDKADAVVLTLPDSICWLFNMRGRDVPNTPFVLGFAVIPRTGKPQFFVDKRKLTPELRQGLKGVASVADAAKLIDTLEKLGAAGKRVVVDPASVPVALVDAIKASGKAAVIERHDPVHLPKSRKNDAEIGGMKEAQRPDAIAMAKFLHWFDTEAPKGKLTEIEIATALESFRREDDSLVDISFDTIAGAGPNGAINHYHVDEKTNRGLKVGELMLVDSGGQYLAGTTDITRTLWTGKASAEQLSMFTAAKDALEACRETLRAGNTVGQLFEAHRSTLEKAGLGHAALNACGYTLGISYPPTWMDWPMIWADHPDVLEPGMVFFLHMILLDDRTGLTMSLADTSIVTDGACEQVTHAPAELVVN